MPWEKYLSAKRLGGKPPKSENGRSPFNSDHDKIIFSGAFRRLGRKTQVHPLALNDHLHNRLTHSLEAACVGRSLGIRVGQYLLKHKKLPKELHPTDIGDIVQSACLAHDIGNPPFGHFGEQAIREWFSKKEGQYVLNGLPPYLKSDFEHFEGNAQGFRLLCTAQYRLHQGGMQLTYATLASFMKYPWTSKYVSEENPPNKDKFGVCISEREHLEEVADAVELRKAGDYHYHRHPLCYLVEAADDICYAILDLEDGLELNLISWQEFIDVLDSVLTNKTKTKVEQAKGHSGCKVSTLRGEVIDAFVDAAVDIFAQNFNKLEAGDLCDPLFKLLPDSPASCAIGRAKKLAEDKVFKHPRKIELEIGAYECLGRILSSTCRGALEYLESEQSNHSKRILDLINFNSIPNNLMNGSSDVKKYHVLMRVIDYVSGMTDNYARHMARQISGMGSLGAY